MIHPDPDPPRANSLTLRELGEAILRGKWVLVGVATVTFGLAVALTLLLPPTYESQSSIQILDQESGGQLLQELGPLSILGLAGIGDSEIDTDMSVLRSRRLVEAVIDSLALHIKVRKPKLEREEVLRIEGGSADAVPGTYRLQRASDGSYTLGAARVRTQSGRYTRSAAVVRELVRPPDRIEIGRPFEMGGLRLMIVPELASDRPNEIIYRITPFQQYVKRVREKDLRVRRPDRGQVVLVEFRYTDRELAAAAVNALADRFIEYKQLTNSTDSRNRVEVLSDQVASYEVQIRDVEMTLQRYQESELIIAPAEQAEAQVRRAAELQVASDAAIMERQALGAVLAGVTRDLEAGVGDESPYRRLATFPSFIANGAVQNLLEVLIGLEERRAQLLVMRQPSNPDVEALTSRIEELELQLLRLAQNYATSLDSQIASAEVSLSRFAVEIAAMPAREIEYARLTRERMLLSEVYLALQQRLKEAEVLAAIETAAGSVRVLDTGLAPERPIFPNPAVNLGLGAILGLMFGLMAVIARESTSSRIRSRTDAETLGVGVPVLGLIPRFGDARSRNGMLSDRRHRVLRGGTARSKDPSQGILVTRELPESPTSDAFRTLRTAITLADPATRPQIVVVTSAGPGEGKSSSVANLAVTLAQQGSRTLLIDADLRTGSLYRLLGVARQPGLVDVISGAVPLREAVHSIEVGGSGRPLDVLASGEPPLNPADLLESERVEQVFRTLRDHYDAILVDAPAVEGVADAALLGRLADTTILVARAGSTEREALIDAVAQLRRLRVDVGGIVLNET